MPLSFEREVTSTLLSPTARSKKPFFVFESAGVIESRSSGMKGTYIKVLNEVIFDELEEIKAQRNKKA